MSASLKTINAISLFVSDLARARAFYVNTFGLEVLYEDESSVGVKFDNVFINLLKEESAHALIEPEVVAGREGGVRMQLSIWVDDANEVCDQLAKAGVRIQSGPVDRDWGMRTATFSDPDGHNWEIAQALGEQ